MLTAIVLLPTAVAALLLCLPHSTPRLVLLGAWAGASATVLALTLAVWAGYGTGEGIQYETNVRWIPSAGIGYHIGVDGLSLPLLALTGVLFLACAVYALRQTHRVREFVALFLFLESTCLGLFVALDLILFFVFFDLSIVAMYFIIAGWGHAGASRAAMKFFLYTFTGSLALLLGFIGLYLAAAPHTFDMVELARQNPSPNVRCTALWSCSPSASDWLSKHPPCPSTPGCHPPTPRPPPKARPSSPVSCSRWARTDSCASRCLCCPGRGVRTHWSSSSSA